MMDIALIYTYINPFYILAYILAILVWRKIDVRVTTRESENSSFRLTITCARQQQQIKNKKSNAGKRQ